MVHHTYLLLLGSYLLFHMYLHVHSLERCEGPQEDRKGADDKSIVFIISNATNRDGTEQNRAEAGKGQEWYLCPGSEVKEWELEEA